MKIKIYFILSIFCLISLLSFSKINEKCIQIQEHDILFSLNEKENFMIENYILYTSKGKFEIDDEVSSKNEYTYFILFNKKIIGTYFFNDENFENITGFLNSNNLKIKKEIGLNKPISFIGIKKDLFELSIKKAIKNYPQEFFKSPEILNDKGYFLYKLKFYDASLIYFIKTIQLFPKRSVAYLNIADNYWALNQKEIAIENYKKYMQLMKEQKKDLKKIPKYVFERTK
jgi:tetratricopeptide (TPR) repeat protein